MVQTDIARPTGILQDYIQSFELRMFDTCNEKMKKPSHAFHEVLISLIIDSKKPPFEPLSNDISSKFCIPSKGPYAGVMGLQTNMKGFFVFQGRFKIFNIQFKPIGFSSIFQIPAILLNDQFLDGYEVFHEELKDLHEQLHEMISFSEMVHLAEKFLERKLTANRNLWKNDCIRKASNSLINAPNAYSIDELAYNSNMSLKTFERKFKQQVGLSPKLFARIRRFNQALDLKTYQPDLSWLDICYRTGYYDPMHMVKDFKNFANMTPTNLFKNAPPLYEDISVYPLEKKCSKI